MDFCRIRKTLNIHCQETSKKLFTFLYECLKNPQRVTTNATNRV